MDAVFVQESGEKSRAAARIQHVFAWIEGIYDVLQARVVDLPFSDMGPVVVVVVPEVHAAMLAGPCRF